MGKLIAIVLLVIVIYAVLTMRKKPGTSSGNKSTPEMVQERTRLRQTRGLSHPLLRVDTANGLAEGSAGFLAGR